MGSHPGCGGGLGAVAGWMGWDGGPGRVAAGSGGGPGQVAGQVIGGGWIFGVNNVLV